MGSKLILDRQKSSNTVQAAGTEYEDKIARGMADMFGAEAEEAVHTLVKLAVAKLKRDTEAMVKADADHVNETADDSKIVGARDEKAANTRATLVELRSTVETVFGADYVRTLGFDADTPSDPTALLNLADVVLGNLDKTPPPATARIGMSADLSAFKAPLSNDHSALSSTLERASTDKRKTDKTLVAKQKATNQYDLTFSTTANLLSHMLKAAGEAELAKRVRPSTRRAGQTMEDAEGETPTKTAP